MRIGILQTGDVTEELIPEYGNYPDMFDRLLGPVDAGFGFEVFRVLDGQLPDHEQACDGWLITGSKFGTYDPLPWIPPLKAFILRIAAAKRPLVGICFGHQIIAEALGGKVKKSDKGWGLGIDSYRLDTEGDRRQASLIIFHQDQVIDPPPEADVFASSDFCRNAGLAIGDRIMTLQAHPEFLPEFSLALLEARRETVYPADLVDQALVQLREQDTREHSRHFAEKISRFLRSGT